MPYHWHTSNNLMTLNLCAFFRHCSNNTAMFFFAVKKFTCKNLESIINNYFLDMNSNAKSNRIYHKKWDKYIPISGLYLLISGYEAKIELMTINLSGCFEHSVANTSTLTHIICDQIKYMQSDDLVILCAIGLVRFTSRSAELTSIIIQFIICFLSICFASSVCLTCFVENIHKRMRQSYSKTVHMHTNQNK